ncbi:histone-like nucleoid-structuring protein Lsr2 [Streptomyces sp. NPDC052101]|uniref:Lsr2 family DNA-binding protein n=1 Tax=Streptomyces sp. NPDC052101 TaxID=3155763 RepID=UPI00341E21D4
MAVLCMGCKKKGSEDRAATTVIVAGRQVWDVCAEHAERFGAQLAAVFGSDGLEAAVVARGSVVITGTIPGYEPEAARLALENAGHRIVGHVQEDTVLIICGIRPAPHKIAEAAAAGTPCMDATRAGVFREAVTSGQWSGGDALPEVAAKKTAADVRHETAEEKSTRREREANAMKTYVEWQRTEVPKRLAESSVRWAEERKEKEDKEIRRRVSQSLPPQLTEAQQIRAWAKEHGYTISNRGVIPGAVREAYLRAHAGQGELDLDVAS